MTNQTSTIPNGWTIVSLGSVLSKKNQGVNTTTEKVEYGPVGFPVIRAQNISIGKIDFSEIVYVDQSTFDRLSENVKPKKGDVLYTNIGSLMGIASVVNTNDAFIIAWNVLRMQPNTKMLSSNFLAYFFNNPETKSAICNLNSSSTIPFVSGGVLERYEMNLPPLSEQHAIAAMLSSLDDKIELLREQNKTLEATSQVIFKEWFVDFNFPNATGKMISSELGKIPEGWRVGGLIENGISEFVKINIDKFDGTKDYVETSNVNLSNFVGNFEKISYRERASRANMQPVADSIWFARMAESRKYLLFQGRDRQNIETKILSTGFAGIKCLREYLYFYWCFVLSNIFNDLKNQYAEGAVQVAISNGAIQRIALALPPKELAKKFTETVGFCFEKISNNNSQIQTLSTLRDTLLPKLMKGEVRVEDFNK